MDDNLDPFDMSELDRLDAEGLAQELIDRAGRMKPNPFDGALNLEEGEGGPALEKRTRLAACMALNYALLEENAFRSQLIIDRIAEFNVWRRGHVLGGNDA